MEKIRKILAPTDFSELSCIGVTHALDMGRARGAEVLVYHVIEIDRDWVARQETLGPVRDILAREYRRLDRFLRDKFADRMNLVEVRQIVELGSASGNIVEKARHESVDLIVMSSHGRTGFYDKLVTGSVAANVVGRAPCPVLVIPAGKHDTPMPKAA